MSKRRADPIPLAAKVDGIRVVWRQPADDGPGLLMAPPSMVEKLEAAMAAKTLVPVMGVLVAAGDATAPAVLAAMHAVSTHSVVVDTMPVDCKDWFAANRATASATGRPENAPASTAPSHGGEALSTDERATQRSAMSGVSSLLKKRVTFGGKG